MVDYGTPTFDADISGTAFGGAPTWTDLSEHLENGADGQPIRITWGRQDEQTDPPPRTMSLALNNTEGWFTPGNAKASPNWDLDTPVRVRFLLNGTTYDLFDGYIDSIEPMWPGGSQAWSVVKVTASDITSRLNQVQPLKSLLVYEMLADTPTCLYPLSEAPPASAVSDISTNSLGPGVRVDGLAAGVMEFGATVDGLIDGTGVRFANAAGLGSQPTSVLSLPPSTFVPAAGAHTVEAWITTPTASPAATMFLFDQGSWTSAVRATLFINSSGRLVYKLSDAAGSQQVLAQSPSTMTICDGRSHHFVAYLDTDLKTAGLYVDGVLVGTDTSASTISLAGIMDNLLGGIVRPAIDTYTACDATIALYAMYPAKLSAARVLAHYQAGVGTASERSDQRFSRLAGYGGLTVTGLPTGRATMGGQQTADKGILECLRAVARTEGTVCYATGAGALTFEARDLRYQAAVGLAITGDDANDNISARRDKQGLINEATAQRVGGASITVYDAASRAKRGRLDAGSVEVYPSTDDDVYQNLAWRVANRKDPRWRVPDLRLNLLTQPSMPVAQAALAATIGTRCALTALPSQMPNSAMDLFIEGGEIALSPTEWGVAFWTSPVGLELSTFVLDSSSYGVLDTNVLAF